MDELAITVINKSNQQNNLRFRKPSWKNVMGLNGGSNIFETLAFFLSHFTIFSFFNESLKNLLGWPKTNIFDIS